MGVLTQGGDVEFLEHAEDDGGGKEVLVRDDDGIVDERDQVVETLLVVAVRGQGIVPGRVGKIAG